MFKSKIGGHLEEEIKETKRTIGSMISKNIVVVYFVVATISALVDIFVYEKEAVESFLGQYLFWCVGVFLFVSFFLHWFRKTADKIAEGIGWEPGSPFQKEVAAADGAFGVLGILSLWICGNFWTATAIGASFMLFFMGVGHVLDIQRRKNYSPLNAGSIVWFGLLMPVVLMTLLVLWKMGY